MDTFIMRIGLVGLHIGWVSSFVLLATAVHAAVPLVTRSDTWQYRKGTNAPQSDWKLAGATLDNTWLSGAGGFGFGQTTQETNNCRTLLPDMVGSTATNYTTLYLRKTFTVTNTPAPGTRLYLRMDFDDGYIAWLDGTYLTNRYVTGAPAEPPSSAVANTSHECSTGNSSPQPAETNDLGAVAGRLPPGDHVLAIVGLNNTRTSTDFVQVPDLFLDTPPAPPSVTNGIGGTIAVDTTWYATNGFYTVTSSVTVLSNVTLTIEPGVTVNSRLGCGLTVYGRLLADGTTTRPITFTRYPGDLTWERIMFIKAADSRLHNCVFEYANCVGDHQNYYPTNCSLPFNVAPRNYFEAVVGLACHLDLEGCVFQNLPAPNGQGDALAIISDDLVHRGPASAKIRGCQFLSIGQGVNTRYAHVLVEDCYFVGKSGDNDDVEMYGEPAEYGLPAPIVRNNLFDMPAYEDRIHPTRCSAIIYNNVIHGSGDHGIVLRDKCAPVVFNNVLYNCPSGGITVQNQADALLFNNTIINCGPGLKLFDHTDRWGLPYCLNPGSGRAIAINCIVWNNTAGWSLAESPYTNDMGSHLTLISCNIQSNGNVSAHSTLTWGPGNLTSNPLFVNQSGFDLHLASASPCVDAGTNSGLFVTTNLFGPVTNEISAYLVEDADRVPRPLDGDGDRDVRMDMGAFEFMLPTADSNRDGIPDGWCRNYGLSPIGPNMATEDPDHDFQSNWQEYLAGTDPTNASSYPVFPEPFGISTVGGDGTIGWSNASPAGVVSILTATNILGPWQPRANYFTTNPLGQARLSLDSDTVFCRLLAADLSTNTPRHYTNLLESYGILETVAGRGLSNVDVSQWLPSYEGEWATNVCLSRPHISFGDSRGNVLIVDQRSSSVLKVTPEGRLYTYAGTHIAGSNGDGPASATSLQLNNPNGGWLGTNDVLYVLDTENAKVRRVSPDGIMTTLFTAAVPMGDGRALWVKSDESLVYFGSGGTATNIYKWTPSGGISLVRNDFKELGNIIGDERTGDLYVSDRGANRVYRLSPDNVLTPIAGNGTQSGGGDGFPALQTGLIFPRCVCFLPNGGFFTCEHSPGNRIWYIDPAGIIHRWMNGNDSNNARVGDGQWFYADPAAAKVSRVRAVNTDPFGNLIITESNYGYVRRIRFQRLTP